MHRCQTQMTREISFRKKPSNSRMNPPRKSRGIHDLLLPLATREMHSAINHKNRASFRITEEGLYNQQIRHNDLFYRLNNVSSGSSKICFVLAGALTVSSVLGLRVLVLPLHQRTVYPRVNLPEAPNNPGSSCECSLALPGIDPRFRRRQRVRLIWSPCTRSVSEDRCCIIQHGVHNAPRLFYIILARKP
jgi:hypothetical protein